MKKPVNEAEMKLMDSALMIFAQKGYEGASIREIIEEAGVTRPVLYYYFQNKEELYRRLVKEKFELLTAPLEKVLQESTDCIDRLKAVARTTFSLAEENPLVIRFILQAIFAPPQCGPTIDPAELQPKRFWMVETIMREGLSQGILSGGDPKSLTLILLGVLDMHLMAKSDNENFHLAPELADGLVDFFLSGAKAATASTTLISPYEQIDNHVIHDKDLS